MIKPTTKVIAADESSNSVRFYFQEYQKGATYYNNGTRIDFVTDGKALYVCAIDTVVTTADKIEDQPNLLKILAEGKPGRDGAKGERGLPGETPTISARFDGTQMIIYADGRRIATSTDLVGPSWKPKLVGNTITWEKTRNDESPKPIDLDDLKPDDYKPILLRTNSDNTKRSDEESGPANFIQWKYEGDAEWNDLISISELMNLTLAGVSIWKSDEDNKWHFGHKKVINAKYTATHEGRQIISDVELGDVLFDAGPIPMTDHSADIALINAKLDELQNAINRIPDPYELTAAKIADALGYTPGHEVDLNDVKLKIDGNKMLQISRDGGRNWEEVGITCECNIAETTGVPVFRVFVDGKQYDGTDYQIRIEGVGTYNATDSMPSLNIGQEYVAYAIRNGYEGSSIKFTFNKSDIRLDLTKIVENCTITVGDINPSGASVTINGNPVSSGDIITVPKGSNIVISGNAGDDYEPLNYTKTVLDDETISIQFKPISSIKTYKLTIHSINPSNGEVYVGSKKVVAGEIVTVNAGDVFVYGNAGDAYKPYIKTYSVNSDMSIDINFEPVTQYVYHTITLCSKNVERTKVYYQIHTDEDAAANNVEKDTSIEIPINGTFKVRHGNTFSISTSTSLGENPDNWYDKNVLYTATEDRCINVELQQLNYYTLTIRDGRHQPVAGKDAIKVSEADFFQDDTPNYDITEDGDTLIVPLGAKLRITACRKGYKSEILFDTDYMDSDVTVYVNMEALPEKYLWVTPIKISGEDTTLRYDDYKWEDDILKVIPVGYNTSSGKSTRCDFMIESSSEFTYTNSDPAIKKIYSYSTQMTDLYQSQYQKHITVSLNLKDTTPDDNYKLGEMTVSNEQGESVTIWFVSQFDGSEDYFEVTPNPINMKIGEPLTISINSKYYWNFIDSVSGTYDVSWLNMTPSSGAGKKETTVILSTNRTEPYEGVLLFSTGNDKQYEISFILSAGTTPEEPKLELSKSELEFVAEGGTSEKITVTNTTGEAWSVKSKPDWVNINTEDGFFVVVAKRNIGDETTSNRSGSIVIKAGELEATLNVSQEGNEVEPEPTKYSISWEDDSKGDEAPTNYIVKVNGSEISNGEKFEEGSEISISVDGYDGDEYDEPEIYIGGSLYNGSEFTLNDDVMCLIKWIKKIISVPVTSVGISDDTLKLTVGETHNLTATIYPENATNKNVSWISDNEGCATVDSNGKVTAVEEGMATITVRTEDGGFENSCDVTVSAVEIPVEYVSLNKATTTLNVGESETLEYEIRPNNATNKNVTWSTSNESIAIVDNGTITAISAGEAVITITTKDGGKTASCTVTVNAPVTEEPRLVLNPSEVNLVVGTSYEDTAIAVQATIENDPTDSIVSWVIGDDTIASILVSVDSTSCTVSSNKVAGDTVLTVSTKNGLSAECPVHVQDHTVQVESVQIVDHSGQTLIIDPEVGIGLTAEISPENANYRSITWSSSNENAAVVEGNGLNANVTGVTGGLSATITVTVVSANGISHTDSCFVEVRHGQIDVESISLDANEISLAPNKTYELTATIDPSTATNKDLSWSSSHPEIASVSADASGLKATVTANAVGTAIITVSSDENPSIKATCNVTVGSGCIDSLQLDTADVEFLSTGGSQVITAYADNIASDSITTGQSEGSSWLTCWWNADGLHVTAEANDTTSERSCEVWVQGTGNCSNTEKSTIISSNRVTVIQAGKKDIPEAITIDEPEPTTDNVYSLYARFAPEKFNEPGANVPNLTWSVSSTPDGYASLTNPSVDGQSAELEITGDCSVEITVSTAAESISEFGELSDTYSGEFTYTEE